MRLIKHLFALLTFASCAAGAWLYFFPSHLLTPIARFLIADEPPERADAAIVLNTGLEIYPRLIEAATLYNNGYVDKIVINGNRKNAQLYKLESMGFAPRCAWYEDHVAILGLFGVPRSDIMAISAENAYDTISEAKAVGPALIAAEMKSIIITTSKTHTARARHIWKNLFSDTLDISTVAAKEDPFDPRSWWTSGGQTRWVLYEYGSWLFYYWERFNGATDRAAAVALITP